MDRTQGRPEVIVGLIDGPVMMENPQMWSSAVRYLDSGLAARCAVSASEACKHGTLVAGILSAKRGSPAPAICPECTLLVRPIFPEFVLGGEQWPGTSAHELAKAIVEAVKAGARVLNLSVDLLAPSSGGERQLSEALNYAAAAGAIAVVAAGNQGLVGSSALTRHPWVIPVIACGESGEPLAISNLGASMATRGVRAPGENITSIGADGAPGTFSGTSAAAPFVSGAAALLWSLFPRATATAIKLALTRFQARRPLTLVPPLLDAWAAYRNLAGTPMRA
ncbi:MAG TPA: S8 family serine peptidase [Candidatus Acidoferrales bacterium]|nr:S8 family serine peptidase [Candidatus Acidoferrales bacterium]